MRRLMVAASVLLVAGCSGESKQLNLSREFGSAPELTEPAESVPPTMNPAKAVGWPEGGGPVPAPGMSVTAFAQGLEHPRWVLPLPNGDVLVAESDRPEGSLGIKGVTGWVASKVMNYAGADLESADRITLLRDTNGDGVANLRTAFLEDLHSPFGMTLVDDLLYIANADAIVRVPYREGDTVASAPPELVVQLSTESMNHHWTKNVIASEDGSKLFVAVGSNSNIGENGIDAEAARAAILEVDPATGGYRVFASGLRNPVGMDWEPQTGALWTVVNERDELGDQLVPDYITSVKDGGFYGWPYSYWGDNVDTRMSPQRPDLVATAIAPDYAVGAHTASLGIAFYEHDDIPTLTGTALIGQHGSWNRNPKSGYKVIAVRFEDGMPMGEPIDVLTGFLSPDEKAWGRPAGVAVAADGSIFVADDAGDAVWRVAPSE